MGRTAAAAGSLADQGAVQAGWIPAISRPGGTLSFGGGLYLVDVIDGGRKSGALAAVLARAMLAGVREDSESDPTVYDGWCEMWEAELRPEGVLEGILCRRVAGAAWRLMRVERRGGQLLSVRASEIPKRARELARERRKGEPDQAEAKGSEREQAVYDSLLKLGRWESILERAFYRALLALRDIQRERLGPGPGGAAVRPGPKLIKSA